MIATVTTSSDKTRQRGHALSTLSLTAYRFPSGFLFVSIVTWPILPHHPTPTPLPVPSSFYIPGLVPSTVTSFPTLSYLLCYIYQSLALFLLPSSHQTRPWLPRLAPEACSYLCNFLLEMCLANGGVCVRVPLPVYRGVCVERQGLL